MVARKAGDDFLLGSIWQNANGNRNAPYLDVDDNRRKLNLNWFDNDWNENCRFLAVCKYFVFPLL
ncbi:MAG: hypothetical protein WC441_03270 [Patescibacteria group bacterium]